jgi:hypothetical protein
LTRRLVGTSGIAAWYGVAQNTVTQWRKRGREYGLPFPEPDTEIATEVPGVFIPGWREDQKAEIDTWRKLMPGMGWRKGKELVDE